MKHSFALILSIVVSFFTSSVGATEVLCVPFKNGIVIVSDKRVHDTFVDKKTGKAECISSDNQIKVVCSGQFAIGAAGCTAMSSKTEAVDIFDLALKNRSLLARNLIAEFGESVSGRYLQILRQHVKEGSFSLLPNDKEVLYELCVFQFNPIKKELLAVKSISVVDLRKNRENNINQVNLKTKSISGILSLKAQRLAECTVLGETSSEIHKIFNVPFPQTASDAAKLAAKEILTTVRQRVKLGFSDVGDTCDIFVIDEFGSRPGAASGTKLQNILNGDVPVQ